MGWKMNISYFVVTVITSVVMTLVDLAFGIFYKKRGKAVSHITDNLLLIPASTIAEKIRSKEVSFSFVIFLSILRKK